MIRPMNRDTFTEILTNLYGGNRGEASIAINEFCDNYNADPDPAELYYEENTDDENNYTVFTELDPAWGGNVAEFLEALNKISVTV